MTTFTALAWLLTGPAFAEDQPIKGFLTDPIEVYDQNEDYVGDYDVGSLDLSKVKVTGENGDLVLVDFGGQLNPAWVFKTDIQWPAGCRKAAGAKVAQAKNASTMGLDGDLCE
ncbi:MAG: hypothetical protein R3F54_05710 [Alphaproteobacteria bacterium]